MNTSIETMRTTVERSSLSQRERNVVMCLLDYQELALSMEEQKLADCFGPTLNDLLSGQPTKRVWARLGHVEPIQHLTVKHQYNIVVHKALELQRVANHDQ